VRDATGRLPVDPPRPADGPTPADRDIRGTLDVAALTRQLVAGDETAYRIFHDAYFDRLSHYLLVVTAGNEDATREALQETFRRVVRHIRVFSDEAAFWSWLTVLARSARSDENRKRRRYLAFLDRFTQYTAIEHAATDDDSHGKDLEVLLEQNMDCLPTEERTLLEAKYYDHRSVREIAGQLQTTEKAIESRLVRTRQKLKQALLAELNHESRD
jgi:RNA polymerase sigma-70 factor (ECF subfamily)